MGILSGLARRGGAFAQGAGNSLIGQQARPITNAAMGAAMGGMGGGVASGGDPRAVMAGAGMGAAGGLGAGAMAGGLKQLFAQMPFAGPGFEAAKAQIAEVIGAEMGGSPVIARVIGQARNADELQSVLQRIMAPTGDSGAQGQMGAQLGGYADRFADKF